MYLPRAFAETDLVALDRLIAAHDFVSLVTVQDGEPAVSHVPVLYRRTDDSITLTGHLARPNPQARHRGRGLVLVQGPHAYVSPGWYADKEAAARVPTWNYAVAHLGGALHWFHDESALAALVSELSEVHERRIGGDWRFRPEREEERVQLRGIVGFELRVDDVRLKFKLSQNHPQANRRGVIAGLEALGGEPRDALASLMRERLGHAPREE